MVALVVWDAGELDARLKDHPLIVDDIFSRAWVTAFNGPEAAAALARADQARAARLTDPDPALSALRQRETLPQAVRDLLAQPVLDDLSRLLSAGEAQQAFSLAARHAQALGESLRMLDDPAGSVASALVSHRQRLLFAAATSASWLGTSTRRAGCAATRSRSARSRRTGSRRRRRRSSTPRCRMTSVASLLPWPRTTRTGRSRKGCSPTSMATGRRPTRAFPESDSPDVLLIRAQARIALLDPLDIEAVRQAEALLDAADEGQPLDSGRILSVRATVDLAKAVMDGQTPLAFDRRPLADAVHRRALRALAAVPRGTALHARAVAAASRAASILRDDGLAEQVETELAAIPDTVQNDVFVQIDALETPEEIAALRTDGLIEAVQAVRMTAGMQERAGDVDRADATLRNALFASVDPQDRVVILGDLVWLLRRNGRLEDANQILEVTPVPTAEQWTLRAQHEDGVPNLREAQAFALHVGVVGLVSHRLLAARAAGDADPADTPTDDGLGTSLTAWTGRLVRLVPSPASRLKHAEALFLDGQHGALLAALDDVGDADPARLAELRAFALEGVGRRGDGADGLSQFAREHPDATRVSVNASALLLRDGRPAAAAALLGPLEAAGATLAWRARQPWARAARAGSARPAGRLARLRPALARL